ncbi:hypothetical protein LCGC14_2347280 [marine sediment metagenome]|uniref:Uncharacterized protein n=1 Tax=marine sediment metagenome TaxID=412755 RepID=A0A0F9CXS3_9ZZZZ
MTYNEALTALEKAQEAIWQDLPGSQDLNIYIHNGITQAIEVFKRMKMDLEAASGKQIECDLFEVDFEDNRITFNLTPDQMEGGFHKGTAIINLAGIRGE